jgi:hypothetical protein
LRRDYAAQRNGANEQRDIARDKADIRADRRDIERDRADIRSDQRDLRADARDVRADRSDVRDDRRDVRSDSDRMRGGHASRTLTAMNEANGARAVHGATTRDDGATQTAAGQPGVTAKTLADNAAANDKKPSATQTAHQPWYHFLWW